MMIGPSWFRKVWGLDTQSVIDDYVAIGRAHKHFVTDVALRGYVFTANPPRVAGDTFQDGINEGRRQLALEIVTLCRLEPQALFDLVEKPPQQGAKR